MEVKGQDPALAAILQKKNPGCIKQESVSVTEKFWKFLTRGNSLSETLTKEERNEDKEKKKYSRKKRSKSGRMNELTETINSR